MVRTLRHCLFGLASFLAVVFAGLVIAQAAPSPATLVGVRAIGPSPGGLSVAATFRALPAAGGAANAAYYTAPALVSSSTLGGLARGLAARTGPGIAALAAVAAAGWVWDQLDQQFKSPQNPVVPLGPQSWTIVLATPTGYHAATKEALLGACQAHNGKNYCAAAPITQHWSGSYQAVMTQDGEDVGLSASFQLVTTPPDAQPYQPPRTVASDAEIGQILLGQPASWPALLTNADGSPVRTPELMNMAATIGAQVAAGNAPNPSQGWDTGSQGGEPLPGAGQQPQPGEGPGPGEQPEPFELPAFCEWATVVCDLAEWMRDDDFEDDDQEIPEIDPGSFSVPWSSGFGGGSCPQFPAVEVLGAEVEFPTTPLCDLAAYIRPLVLLAAALTAVFVLVGVRRAS